MRRCAARPRSRAPAERRAARPLRRWGRRVQARPRHLCRRWLRAPLSLAFIVPAAQGAAFLPGAEADPPTGAVVRAQPSAAEPLQGSGIQWTLGPWRQQGLLAADLRSLRLEDGSRTRQSLLLGDLDMASYIWQPWFVQLRFGLGFVTAQDQGQVQGLSTGGSGTTVTGRAAFSVFPASRFPLELRADFGDSRSSGLNVGGEYRSRRLSVSQGWRPETGNDHVQLQLDQSQLLDATSRDTLTTFSAAAAGQRGPHALELGLGWSDNTRTDTASQTRLGQASARHSWRPASALSVETLASWNDVRFAGTGLDGSSDVKQLSSFMSWRPPLQPLPDASQPLVTATARWVQVRSAGSASSTQAEAVNASVGVTQELSSTWRGALSANASQLQSRSGTSGHGLGVNAALIWTPEQSLRWGWRYAPQATASTGYARGVQGAARQSLGAQATHGLSRDFQLNEQVSLSAGLTQSAGVLHETGQQDHSRALAHGASLSWQRLGSDGGQLFAGLSYHQARSMGESEGLFQLINAQISQRASLGRYASWSANLSYQASNNRSSVVDVFTGQRRDLAPGWQQFYNGSLTYENQFVLGVPRLRLSVVASVSSQPLEQRALGDIDAPRERISESLETRLDHALGRLETRLSVRVARVEGRVVQALQARAQRRF